MCGHYLDDTLVNENGKTAKELEKLAKEEEFRNEVEK